MSSANPYGPQPGQPGQPGPLPGPQGQPPNPYGSAPPPGSGYSFGPFAPGPGGPPPGGYPPGGPPPGGYPPGGGYGGPPVGAPPPVPPGSGPKRGRRIAIIAGAVVLVLAAGTAIAVVATRDKPTTTAPPQSSQQASPGGTTPGGTGSTAAPAATTASDAVKGYLQALSSGDAQAALSYAADPVSGPLLTNSVLADSHKRAPLTTVDVPAVADPDATSVPATYQLGKTPVSESFNVIKVGDQWKLTQVTKAVDVGLVRQASVPMKINGVTIAASTVTLLPGSYAFTTGLSYLSYGSKSTVLLKSPSDQANVYSLRATLTSAGKRAVVSTAKKRYQKCLKAHALKPSNCPFGGTSTYTYKASTIRWKQSGKDPFRKAKVTIAGSTAQVSIPFSVKISGDCRFKGAAYRCSGSQKGRAVGYVTVTKKPLAVRWL
jgi:hypothetical protein